MKDIQILGLEGINIIKMTHTAQSKLLDLIQSFSKISYNFHRTKIITKIYVSAKLQLLKRSKEKISWACSKSQIALQRLNVIIIGTGISRHRNQCNRIQSLEINPTPYNSVNLQQKETEHYNRKKNLYTSIWYWKI